MTSSERSERWCQKYHRNIVTISAKNPTPSTVTNSDDHQAGAFASASCALGATRETHAAGWPEASESASQGHADAVSAVAFTVAATQRSHREANEFGSESSGEDTSDIVLFQGATAARAGRRAYARGVRRRRDTAWALRPAACSRSAGLRVGVFAPRESVEAQPFEAKRPVDEVESGEGE